MSNTDWGAKGVFEEKKKKEEPVQDIFGGNKNKKMKADVSAFPTLPGFEESKTTTTTPAQQPETNKPLFNDKAMPALGQEEPEVIVKKGGPKGKKRGAPL